MSLKQMSILLGFLVGLATLHAAVLVPSIRGAITGDIDEKIERHRSRGVHPGAVTHDDLKHILEVYRREGDEAREFRRDVRTRLQRLEAAVGK